MQNGKSTVKTHTAEVQYVLWLKQAVPISYAVCHTETHNQNKIKYMCSGF